MDVTAKFYALARTAAPAAEVDRFSEATAILESISAGNWDVQDRIDKLDKHWLEGQLVSEGERAVRTAIVAVLYEKLKSQVQAMQEREIVKLEREIRIDKYFQPKFVSLGAASKSVYVRPTVESLVGAVDPVGAPVEAEWQHEGVELLFEYQRDTDQVAEVRKRVCETGALLSVLSSKALEQQEVANAVLGIATDSVAFVAGAERELNKAAKHNSSYKLYLVVYFWLLSLVLWLLHWVA